MTLMKVRPDKLVPGDDVIINAQSGMVKYIDGPDHHGTYDVHLIGKDGKEHIEIVTDTVTISL